MILIGLTGPAGSGKDTFADELYERFAFAKTSFAAPLKLALQAIFGFSAEQLSARHMKEAVADYWGFSPRYAAQKLGTEGCRNLFGEDVWIKRWLLTYFSLQQTDDVVVTDVRFDNEADTIRKLGGYIVHIRRGHNPLAIGTSHASEQGISFATGDFFVENDGTVEDLKACAREVFRRCGGIE